ncbi:MAG TPA: RNA polymerase sigma factor [Armatimonadota bacterium]|nr:RNA polymerase sigma factor [Armatimonadota bacterium]
MASDDELIGRSLAGDRAAFDDLVLRYQDSLFRHLLVLSGHPQLAEDLCQEALIRFYRTLARFHRGWPVAPLLFKIATNLWRDGRRRRAAITTDSLDALPGDCAVEPEVVVLQRLQRGAIADAIARLRWEYRAVISLRYDQGLSYREIAQALRVSVGTVAAWLHRAVDELRAALDADAGEEVAR